ncbi:MAG TPA: ATP-binding protein, partial [Aquella sp.]|nr:ATP-binding protein [Aquella sp.]
QAFKRAISNIINNAVDAFDNRAGEIIVSLNTIDNEVQIIIEDNGSGMPEAVREKILNHISVTNGKANGHGIGYTQIQDMLAKNNGTLQIQSRQNIGTKIILTFPKATVPE